MGFLEVKYDITDKKFYANDGATQYEVKYDISEKVFKTTIDGKSTRMYYMTETFPNFKMVMADSNSMKKYDSAGNYLGGWGQNNWFNHWAIEVDSSGIMYIAAEDSVHGHSIYKVAADFNYIMYSGGESRATSVESECITLDSSGNIYVGYQWYDGTWHFEIRKYDNDGSLLLTIAVANYIAGIKVDSSGNIYVGGDKDGDLDSVWKYNSAGVEQWSASLGDTYCSDIAIDGTYVYAIGDSSNTVYKLNQSNGAEIYAVVQSDDIDCLVLDGSGNIFTGGRFVSKLNNSAVSQWETDLGVDTYMEDIDIDSSSNVYVAGYDDPVGAPPTVDTFWKLNSSGVEQWSKLTHFYFSSGLTVDDNDDIYVLGFPDDLDL